MIKDIINILFSEDEKIENKEDGKIEKIEEIDDKEKYFNFLNNIFELQIDEKYKKIINNIIYRYYYFIENYEKISNFKLQSFFKIGTFKKSEDNYDIGFLISPNDISNRHTVYIVDINSFLQYPAK